MRWWKIKSQLNIDSWSHKKDAVKIDTIKCKASGWDRSGGRQVADRARQWSCLLCWTNYRQPGTDILLSKRLQPRETSGTGDHQTLSNHSWLQQWQQETHCAIGASSMLLTTRNLEQMNIEHPGSTCWMSNNPLWSLNTRLLKKLVFFYLRLYPRIESWHQSCS